MADEPGTTVRSRSGTASRAFRSTSNRCAVRLPTPGTATSASRSSSARQRRRLGGECTDRIASASFGPDPARGDQRLERVAFVAGGETEQDQGVVAHVLVREQERARTGFEVGHRVDRHEYAIPDPGDLDEDFAAQAPFEHRAADRTDHDDPSDS